MTAIDPNLLTWSEFAYNCTVVVISIGAAIGWLSYVKEKAMQRKYAFLGCTAQYIKIQETIITTDCLRDLNLSIYPLNQSTPCDDKTLSSELSLCGMMFQLMENVWLIHDFEKNKRDKLHAGWHSLFIDWMKSEKIERNWGFLKHHFSKEFIAYVEKEWKSNPTAEANV